MLHMFAPQTNEILVFFTPSAYIPFIGEENFSHSHTVATIIYSTIMKIAVNCILTSFLAVIFLWQGWSTLCKYRAGKTTLQVLFNNPCHAVVIIWLCLHRLRIMMMEIFSFLQSLSVKTTCLQ